MNDRPRWSRLFIEGIVIVVSILAAFGIDAAWDARQERVRRAKLIEALQLDLRTTQERLASSRARGDSLTARAAAFLQAIESQEPLPIDSLRYLAGGAFTSFLFYPALSSYEAAVATGDLRLVQTSSLLDAITDFRQFQGFFEEHVRINNDIYYVGSSWELRRAVGSQGVIEGNAWGPPAALRMSDDEYREWMRRPEVYAGVENATTAHRNMIFGLRGMDRAVSRALREIEAMR
jgi:hypothetical protein